MLSASIVDGLVNRTGEIFAEVVEFAVRVGGQRCFPGWPRRTIEEYLCGHLLQGTCAFVRGEECHRPIVGVGVGWQLNEREVREAGFAEQPWRWQGTNPLGDSFFVADLMATERRAIGALAAELQWRWPQWRKLKLFSVRRGKVVEYRAEEWFGRMERLL